MTSNISVGSGTAHSQPTEPRMIQMLTEDGNRVQSGEYDAFAAELT
ncbi:pyruvate dehydrogenase (acetyl-transferring) E1 component subunit alpha, partial [Burkholderia multivorans]